MSASPLNGPTAKIWRDGVLVDFPDATVHVMAHAMHYGSSIFEGIRCYEQPDGSGAVFRLREHMRRLHDSAKIYRIPMRHPVEALCEATLATIAANGVSKCYIRPLVARTGQQMGIFPRDVPVETFIICWHWGAYLGQEALAKGVDVRVSSWRRAAPNTFPTLAKAGGNYLNSQLTKMEARADDYVEGIMLDSAGFVAEGSGENLFIVRDGVLYTAPVAAGILDGITRDSVLRIAADLGIPVREMMLPREFLYVADEAFFSGTAAELTPIRSVDRIPVGSGEPGPISLAIQQRYMGIATGALPDPWGWRSPVPQPAASAR